MKETNKRYRDAIFAIYQDCERSGSITAISQYAKTYGVSQSLGTVLCNLSILKKEGSGRYCSYSWQLRRPDSSMVIEVLDAINHYVNKSVKKAEHQEISETRTNLNFNELLEAFDMLPKSISLNERKTLAKKMVEWKNS